MSELLNNIFSKEPNREILILALAGFILLTLLIALPQLLRANLRKAELWHEQRLKSLEKGIPLPPEDDRTRLAARIALIVPSVVIISTATVTSFLIVYQSDHLFAVSLAIWVVAGVVSLAAITGGVALMGRLALLQAGELDEQEEEDEPSEHSYMK